MFKYKEALNQLYNYINYPLVVTNTANWNITIETVDSTIW